MKGIFKTLLILVVFFIILGIGTTIKFWKATHYKLEKELHIIAQDTLELSMIDEYRKNHISKIDGSLADQILINMIKEKFKLDSNLKPIEISIIEDRLVITAMEIEEGKFGYDADTITTIQKPYIYIKGYTNKSIMIPFVKRKFPIPFEVYVENNRYD